MVADATPPEGELHQVVADPVQKRLMRRSLEVLAGDKRDPALQEMARDVLSGRSSIREVEQTSAYAEALISRADSFKRYWDSISDEEREQLAARGARLVEEQREEMAKEQARDALSRAESSGQPRHSAKGWSLY
jgi:hypothetical protein